jgi:uncharacterized membrane protein (UPF0127 family)
VVLTLGLALAAALAPGKPACIVPDGTRVSLELAISDEEKRVGLMFRDTLGADSGMLFIFDSDAPLPFWMKNTFVPLDFVWLSAGGEVVDVRANVQPCQADPCPSYPSARPARAVLEVNGGFASAHGIRPGVHLQFENLPGFPVGGGAR